MADQALVPRENGQPRLSAAEVELVKKTIATGATDEELKLFLHDCARQGVHPLDKLIHFTKRGGRYTPITSIDFMRMRAADSGELAGNDDPEYTFADDEAVIPKSASVTVYRLVQGQRCPFKATARWAEYLPPKGQDHMWLKMPQLMLGKCAEALALRKAFPKQLHGIYERAEMDQAGRVDEPKVSGPALKAGESRVAPSAPADSGHHRIEPDTGELIAESEVLFPDPEKADLLSELQRVVVWVKREKKAEDKDITNWKKSYLRTQDPTAADLPDLAELKKYLKNRYPAAPWKDVVAL